MASKTKPRVKMPDGLRRTGGPVIHAPTEPVTVGFGNVTREELSMLKDSGMLANDLYLFATMVCGYEWLIEKVHGPLCDFLARPFLAVRNVPYQHQPYPVDWEGDGSGRGRLTRVLERRGLPSMAYRGWRGLVKLPRGAGKTMIAGGALPPWILTQRPDWSILIGTLDERWGTKILDVVQGIISSPRFRYLYGEWHRPDLRNTLTEKTFACRKGTSLTPSLAVVTRGSLKPGMHPHVAIVDDIIDDKYCESAAIASETDAFWDKLQPLMIPPNLVYTIGTSWGFGDFYARRLEGENTGADLYERGIYNPDGTRWCSERYDEAWETSMRATMTDWMFSLQYLNEVIPKGNRAFDIKQIEFYKFPDELPARDAMVVHLAVDPADARGDGESKWAIKVDGYVADGKVYDVDSFAGFVDGVEAGRRVVGLAKKWDVDTVMVEATAISKQWIDSVLKPMMDEAGISRNLLVELSHGGHSKEYRVMSVENAVGLMLQKGRYYVRRDNHELVRDIANFPSDTKHADLLDATAYIAAWVGDKRHRPRARRAAASEGPRIDPVLQQFYDECSEGEKAGREQRGPRYRWLRPGVRAKV